MPPRPSSTPSDIAAHKQNTQKKVEASQRSTGEKDDESEYIHNSSKNNVIDSPIT
jgi:hypothetical protein